MQTFIITIFILVSIALIVVVLLQSGKGADIGAVFGGAGGQALFGSSGPVDFLNKATWVLAIIFMILALTIGYFGFKSPQKSIMDTDQGTGTKPPISQPVAPLGK